MWSRWRAVYGRDSFCVLHGIDGMLFLNLSQGGQEKQDWWP